MRLTLKRALSLALCLCLLLPGLALAEKDASGVRFELQASMNPDAYPESERTMLRGIADLVEVLSLSGTLETAFTGSMDLNAELLLNGAEETRTAIRIFGPKQCWGIQSSLFGDQTLFMNLGGMLEFGMKAYFHLNLPLQYAGLLISPYIHTNAFDSLLPLWQDVMQADAGSRVIGREELLALAQRLAQAAENDRAFTYWVKAVALDAGYDEVLQGIVAALPEWADAFLGEEGVTVTAEQGKETWRTGETTLFSRIEDGSLSAWTLTLPPTLDGYTLSAACTVKGGDMSLRITIVHDDETVLDARVTGEKLPQALPIAAPFALSVDLTGAAAGDGTHLRFAGEGEDGSFALHQLDAVSGEVMLTISGTLIPYDPAETPDFSISDIEDEGVSIFTLNDMTLSELLIAIQQPLLEGMLPILLHVPASSFQSLLDLLTDSGILGMLSGDNAGEAEGNGEYGEGWDENAWSGEEADYYGYADEDAKWDESDEESFDDTLGEDADWDYYAAADGEEAEYETDAE